MAQPTQGVANVLKNSSLPMEGVYKLRLYPSHASPLSFVPLGAKHLDCTKFRLPSRYAIRPLKVTIAWIVFA